MKRIFNPAKRKRILIVDGDENLAHIYRGELHGFDVEVAGNNKEARQKIEEGALDLAILDFSMPGTESVEILEKIRSSPETQALPVIVLSNPFLSHLLRAADNADATRCATKAECTRREFVRIVREMLATDSGRVACEMPGAALDEATIADPTFLQEASETLASLRVGHHAFLKTEEEDLRRVELCEMRQQVHFLAGLAGLAGFSRLALLASALEALFMDLHAKPRNIKPSVARTIAQAVDRMASLLDETSVPTKALLSLKVLVVDDEMITRKTICSAMDKAGLMVVSLNNPEDAQRLLERDHFDLIFLDIEMPRLNGIELCARIRKMPANRATPIVFVTGHSDFEFRAQSILSGGTDFIAKPFISVELGVKALTWLFKENPRGTSAATARNSSPAKTKNYEAAGYATLELAGAFA